MLGLRGLGKKRAPQKDGRPEEKCHDAEGFGEREGELGEGEGVDGDEGEEADGYQVGFHGFVLVRVLTNREGKSRGDDEGHTEE